MRFGPLNRPGGERRLNVAITRARHRVVVISSLRAHDLDLSRTDARGVHLLRAYLDYAERGPAALQVPLPEATGQGFDSPFEQEVCEELRRIGLTVHPQVGCGPYRIDLGVVDPQAPGRYLLGVECDGATYHSSATARDRDRLRQQVLETLGWRICRVWSTDWVRDRHTQVQRILTALHQARTEAPASDVADSPYPLSTPQTHYRPPSSLPQSLSLPGAYDSIDDVPSAVLTELVLTTLRDFGATPTDELIATVARRLGFQRTGSRIHDRLEHIVAALVQSGRIQRNADQRLQVSHSHLDSTR
ncbi:MAG: hypothetical protein C4297_04845 [Gemmataceae bacterium]